MRACEKGTYTCPSFSRITMGIRTEYKVFHSRCSTKKSYSWEQADVIVSSIDTAKRSPHRDIVLNLEYDLIIIDEAHKLKNNKTKTMNLHND